MRRKNDAAVSTVVGELLMVSVVLVMVGVLVIQSGMIIPPGRTPVVTIRMNTTPPGSGPDGSVMLWHKGGDYVEISTMKVSVGDTVFPPEHFTVYNSNNGKASRIFDLGGRVVVNRTLVKTGDIVRLYTPETVLFSGTVGP